jgi:hypothetical protein
MLDLFLMEWVTKMKPGSNSVEDHPQLSHNRHPVDGALVGAASLWLCARRLLLPLAMVGVDPGEFPNNPRAVHGIFRWLYFFFFSNR